MNNNATEDHPLLNVGLPKWPALLIVGESVTEDQAAEIIIRTGHWPICINDRAWEREVHAILGVVNPYEDVSRDVKSINALYETFTAWKERMGVLDMEYLYNSQVGSAYIGGPHGWCDWRGVIGCSDYNIGKYPDTVEVLHDWQKIAEAFPFLKLKSQLFNGESCESLIRPVIQYNVEGGKVDVVPVEDLKDHPTNNIGPELVAFFTNPLRERGCKADVLRRAVQLVRTSRGIEELA